MENLNLDSNIPNKKGSDLEMKESLDLPVYIFYRDNDLYSTLVPKIVADMEKIGRRVIVHSFPQGTPETEIKNYFGTEEVKNSLKNIEIFSDNTCKRQIDTEIKTDDVKKQYDLDEFSEKVMGSSLIGKEIFEKEEEINNYPGKIDAIHSIIKKIIDKNGEPEYLYIVELELMDHCFENRFFRNIGCIGQAIGLKEDFNSQLLKIINDPEQFKQRIEHNSNYKEAINLGFDRTELIKIIKNLVEGEDTYAYKEMWENFVASKIKESLATILNEERIKIVKTDDDIGKIGNNCVLYDRHAALLGGKFCLPLPIASMIKKIIENKLLDINFDNMDKVLEEEIEKVFKK